MHPPLRANLPGPAKAGFQGPGLGTVSPCEMITNKCNINNGMAVSEGAMVLIRDAHVIASNSPDGIDNDVIFAARTGLIVF